MKHVLLFLGWLLRKWFVSEDGWLRQYERAVVRDPVPLFVLTLLLYGVVWGLSLIPMAVVDAAVSTAITTWIIIAAAVFGNYFRILLAAQYRLYQREQQHIIDRLKREH